MQKQLVSPEVYQQLIDAGFKIRHCEFCDVIFVVEGIKDSYEGEKFVGIHITHVDAFGLPHGYDECIKPKGGWFSAS